MRERQWVHACYPGTMTTPDFPLPERPTLSVEIPLTTHGLTEREGRSLHARVREWQRVLHVVEIQLALQRLHGELERFPEWTRWSLDYQAERPRLSLLWQETPQAARWIRVASERLNDFTSGHFLPESTRRGLVFAYGELSGLSQATHTELERYDLQNLTRQDMAQPARLLHPEHQEALLAFEAALNAHQRATALSCALPQALPRQPNPRL